MADKKSTKPATKSAAKKAAPADKSLAELQADLQAARKSHAAGELVNPRVLGQYRKQIARALTKQHHARKETT